MPSRLTLCRVLRGEREGLRRLRVKVEDPPRRRHMVFMGAAVLADIMRDQPEFWIRWAAGRQGCGGSVGCGEQEQVRLLAALASAAAWCTRC